MSEFNVNVSHLNSVQMDRHQNDMHRGPVVYQAQNAEINKNEAEKRVKMPVQPDSAEGKTIDPDDKRQEKEKQKKRNRQQIEKVNHPRPVKRTDQGYIVDIEA